MRTHVFPQNLSASLIGLALPLAQVLLGLGLATLRAKSAQSAVQVEGCGARLAGLLASRERNLQSAVILDLGFKENVTGNCTA